jgi:subtilisin family serine protease
MTPWTLQINTLNPHGTAVAGIAAASENGQGIVGVAPEAKLAGIRLFGNTDPLNYNRDPWGKQVADAWGTEYMRRQPLASAALESGVTQGRKGLGNTYVFAGGNEGNY